MDEVNHLARVYLDGTLVGEVTGQTGTHNLINGGLCIGNGTGINDGFKGTVDELSYWTKALSTQEISGLYNGGNGQTMVNAVSNTGNMFLFFLNR